MTTHVAQERQQSVDYWDGKARFFASEDRQKQNRRMAELYEASCWRYIEPILPSIGEGRVMEAGCGTGKWVQKLAPMGYEMELLDFSGEMIRHARELAKRRGIDEKITGYHVQDICDMAAVPDNDFDLSLATGVPLSLCGDPKRAVAELFRITKPGGHVVCDVDNKYRAALDLTLKNNIPQLLNAMNHGKVVSESGQALNCFSKEELEVLFKAQGFDSCRISAILPFFQFPPLKQHVEILDDDAMFNQFNNIFQALSEEPGIIGLSSRLLVVARVRG